MPGIAEVTVSDGSVSVEPTTVLLLDRHLSIPGVETNRLISRYTKAIDNHPTTWKLGVLVGAETDYRSGKFEGSDMKDIVAAGISALLSLKRLRD